METRHFVIVVLWALVSGLMVGCNHQGHHHGEANFEKVSVSGEVLVIDLLRNEQYQPLLTGVPQTCGMRSGRVYLQPGEFCGEHSTKAHEEMLVFLSGEGVSLIGPEKRSHSVGEGKVIYIPPHTIHNIQNTGEKPLIYIYCVTPITIKQGE